MMERLKSLRRVSEVLTIFLIVGSCSGKTVPAVFIFGDSLVDAGNNFYIKTLATPVSPNGIDFGTLGPSGRYTNNRTIPDIIEEELGFNLAPPYLPPTTVGDRILKGVNYASSGAGILNETGAIYGDRITFDMQISCFENTRQEIISRIGEHAAKSLLTRSLYFLAIGSNDVTFFKRNTKGKNLSSDAYTDIVISRFRSQLTRLYHLDARKIVVANVGAAGCMPSIRDNYPPGNECLASVNSDAKLYNSKLKVLLAELTLSNTKSKYVLADASAILEDIIQNYESYGFERMDYACCHIAGIHGGLFPCANGAKVCADRSKYVFWDAFHPSYAANMIAAKYLMDGGSKYISPVNIRLLLN